MSKVKKLISGKFIGSKSAEFVADTNKLFIFVERNPSGSALNLEVKGVSEFVSFNQDLLVRLNPVEEVNVIKGLTYRLSINHADYSSGPDKEVEALVSICFGDDK